MILSKVTTAVSLYREGGIAAVRDHSRLKFRLAFWKSVQIDGCTFSLEGLPEHPTKISLINDNYEAPERAAVARYLSLDAPLIELGGSIGILSCIVNKRLKNPSAHIVVEANPLAIPFLEKNREANRCKFQIVNRAVAYGRDTVAFYPSSYLSDSAIEVRGDQPEVEVPTVQLGKLASQHGFSRYNLLCDIEGEEIEMVANDADAFASIDTIIMENHARFTGEDKVRSMMQRLSDMGFRLIDEIGYVVVLRRPS